MKWNTVRFVAVELRGSPLARILLVEDEAELRDLWQEFLAGFGHDVLVASSVNEAIQAVDGLEGTLDLVLIDWTLPDGRGNSVVDHARKHAPAAHLVITSGMGPRLPSNHGADGVLGKPFKIRDLLRVVGIATGAQSA